MNIAKYTFISPYSSPIQVGRLDPSSVEESSSDIMKQNEQPPSLASQEQQLKELQIVDRSVKENTTSIVPISFSLDIYA